MRRAWWLTDFRHTAASGNNAIKLAERPVATAPRSCSDNVGQADPAAGNGFNGRKRSVFLLQGRAQKSQQIARTPYNILDTVELAGLYSR